MNDKKIWLSPPHMGGEEMAFVRDAFDTNWVAPAGPHISAFEKELAAYTGVGYCAALSSGTAAIHLALIIVGVGRGDDVLCSTFTFSGSCNPVVYQGAVPVFVDSEPVTWNMDPVLLEQAIKSRIASTGRTPKAIIVVHLYGMPARMDEIMSIAERYQIPVIEDAAEALGASYKGKKAGGLGHIGIFSFNGNKIITTSGGGALLSNNEAWVEEARFLATQARDPAPHYQHSRIGFNYRLSNVCAAIGRGQLRVLDQRVAARRRIFERYREQLSVLPAISFPSEVEGFFPNRWLTTAVMQRIDNQSIMPGKVADFLASFDIESRPLWKPMHLQPVFRDAPSFTSGVAEDLFATGICLPSGSSLTGEQQNFVIEKMKQVWGY